MMNDRQSFQIGVFDSGVGGLTVVQQLMKALPAESITYFGDTARVPYGGKSRETVIRYSIENTILLMERNIKILVVACNTVSALAIHNLRRIFNIPIIGTIEPGAEKAVKVNRGGPIGVIGTRATIKSGAYQDEIKRLNPECKVLSVACPLFVPLVEENFFHHHIAQLVVKEYLEPLKREKIDTLLLGCTHYPFLNEFIQMEMGPDVQIVDSDTTCSEKVVDVLQEKNLRTLLKGDPTYQYLVSDDPQRFSDLAERLFGSPIKDVKLCSHPG